MPGNSNNNESNGSSDVVMNDNSRCNTFNTENDAVIVFLKNRNGIGHIPIGGKTLRAHQDSLPNNGFLTMVSQQWDCTHSQLQCLQRFPLVRYSEV